MQREFWKSIILEGDDAEYDGAICDVNRGAYIIFAGLVGTRSPYGTSKNAFDERFIPGGSSSGSGALIGRGLATFALGTDTAGSGQLIYAPLNHHLEHK